MPAEGVEKEGRAPTVDDFSVFVEVGVVGSKVGELEGIVSLEEGDDFVVLAGGEFVETGVNFCEEVFEDEDVV